MSRGRSFRGHVKRPADPDFQLDGATQALISQTERLIRNGVSFSLRHYRHQAELVFQQGTTPVVEHYLEGDLGECTYFLTGRYPKPWTALSLAEIFRHNHKSFTEIGTRLKKMGNTLAKLLSAPNSNPEREATNTLKILGCVKEALTMFPKEPPRYMPFVPSQKFEDVVQQYRASRKEMRKLWTSCVEYVQMQEDSVRGQLPPSRSLPASWQRQTQIPDHNAFLPEYFETPSSPPPPPRPAPEAPSFVLGLQSQRPPPKSLTAEPLEVGHEMALPPSYLHQLQARMSSQWRPT